MNEFEKLVEYITKKVIQALEQESLGEAKKGVFMIGPTSPEVSSFFEQQQYQLVSDMTKADALCLNELSVPRLRRVALMIPNSQEEEAIVTFLLNKQPVFVLESGRNYQINVSNTPYSMTKELATAETKWRQFGAKFIKLLPSETVASELKVLSVSQLMKADYLTSKKVIVNDTTIITPLAKDFIREHNLQLIYNRNEE